MVSKVSERVVRRLQGKKDLPLNNKEHLTAGDKIMKWNIKLINIKKLIIAKPIS